MKLKKKPKKARPGLIEDPQSFSADGAHQQVRTPGGQPESEHPEPSQPTRWRQLAFQFQPQPKELVAAPQDTRASTDFFPQDLCRQAPVIEAPADSLLSSLQRVETDEDFCEYVQNLLADLFHNREAWNNSCLHSFLDAVAYAPSYVARCGEPGVSIREPSWKLFAAILHVARFYADEDFEECAEEPGDELFEVQESSGWSN